MKKMLVLLLTVSFLLMQAAVYAQSDQSVTKSPPVSQPLVREGDFAIKLVETLKIGKANNEAEAETMLGASGITPKNGWIADYPVTPDVIGELQKAVSEAADAKRLPMGKEEALKGFRTATVEVGIPIVAEVPGKYAEGQPPTSYEYTSPEVVNNYYYEEGPPVITYYPPPWDYWYLYSWVPCPFFFSGFFFSGFFALHDFHRVVIFANQVVVVSNHVISPVNGTVVVIDPPTRTIGNTVTPTSVVATKTATSTPTITGRTATSTPTVPNKTTTTTSVSQGVLTSPEARKAATSILERSQQRVGTGSMRGMTGQTKPLSNVTVGPPTSRSLGSSPSTSTITGRTVTSTPTVTNKTPTTTSVSKGVLTSPEATKAATSIPERSQQRVGTNSMTGMTGQTKPFSNVTVGPPTISRTMGPNQGRTFRSSESSVRSFSPPSGSSSVPRGSTEGFHGGGGSHSFRGFSGGDGGFHSGGRR